MCSAVECLSGLETARREQQQEAMFPVGLGEKNQGVTKASGMVKKHTAAVKPVRLA